MIIASTEKRKRQNTLSFTFAALEFAYPDHVRIKYRLSPIDDRWINSQRDGFVRYSKLSPGTYSLEVKASTSIGVWSKIKKVKIRIQKPFYQTWWFIFLCLVAFGSTICTIYHNRQRRKRKLHLALEKQRNEFARDMHDELGSSISSLKLSVEYIIKQAPTGDLKLKLQDIAGASQSLYQI